VKKEKILLLAFRSGQVKFFKNMQQLNENLDIVYTKYFFKISLKSFKYLNKFDNSDAVKFAVDEFYAKTNNLIFPNFLIKSFFIFLSYFNYIRYFKILDNDYDKVLIWNGGKFRQRIAIEIAKLLDIKVYYYENGLMPNRIVFDNKGINYDNSVPRDRSFFESYQNDKKLPTKLIPRISKHKDKFEIEKNPLPEKYIFVPFQVDYDTQILSQSPWIKSMRDLFDAIEYVCSKSKYHFILKEHPSSHINYPDLHNRAKKLNNVSFENGYDTQNLIENSIAVITINSTVGVESLLFSKKVIILGNAFYNIEGISFGVKNKDELLNIVNNIENIEFNKELVDSFLKYLYYDYLVAKDEDMYKNFIKRLSID